jgi:uroporphyrinogen-III synthase
MAQNRVNILCTRDLDEALIQDALSKSIAIDVISFIRPEPALTSEALNEVQKASMRAGAVIFTSVNAVETIVTSLDQQKTNPTGWKIFCIGYATKQSVVKNFGEKSIAGVADNAKELANAILDADVDEVIFFCGDQRRDELPGLLKKNKIEVKEIVVYKTIANSKKIEKKYDGILFFSPSAVKSFFQENKLDDQTILFAIGNTTADEVKKFSKNKIIISDTPEGKTVLQKAVEFFQTNSIHH